MNEQANSIEKKNKEELTLLMAHQEENGGEVSTWHLDNSASNYMRRNKNIFTEIDRSIGGFMTIEDGSKVEVKGNIMLIHLKDGRHRFNSNVFYVLFMKSNILSLGQPVEKNYKILLKDKIVQYDMKKLI